MKTILITTLCLTFLSLFGQEIQTKEDIELYKRNHVKQIDIIQIEIKDFNETPKDTIFCDQKFDKSGRLIERKYYNGSKIRHLYFYNNEGQIMQELRLTTKDFFNINDLHKRSADSVYVDTSDIKIYQYKNKRIDFVVGDSKHFKYKNLIKYKYSNKGHLLTTYQTDSAESYIDDFTIYKYVSFKDTGIKLAYKVSNYQHMTSNTSYYYKNNGDQDYQTHSFNGISTTSHFNSDGLLIYSKTTNCDNQTTKEGKVTFRQDGLIDFITYYKFDSQRKILIPTAKEIFHYDRY